MQAQLQQIEPVFQAVAYCIQYPADALSVLPAGFKDRQEWEETDQVMQERRQEFFVLFKNMAKLSLDMTVKFVSQELQSKLHPQTPVRVGSSSPNPSLLSISYLHPEISPLLVPVPVLMEHSQFCWSVVLFW